MNAQAKKHPCPDCQHCQWCSDDRCRLCLNGCAKRKLSIAEQLALYDKLNSPQTTGDGSQTSDLPSET